MPRQKLEVRKTNKLFCSPKLEVCFFKVLISLDFRIKQVKSCVLIIKSKCFCTAKESVGLTTMIPHQRTEFARVTKNKNKGIQKVNS